MGLQFNDTSVITRIDTQNDIPRSFTNAHGLPSGGNNQNVHLVVTFDYGTENMRGEMAFGAQEMPAVPCENPVNGA